MKRYLTWLWLMSFTITGCSSVSGLIPGLGGDRYPLLKEAKARKVPPPVDLPHELNKGVLENYILEPGDGLLILPADLDSPVRLAADQVILPDGSIDLGRFGRVMAAGKTVQQVEDEVQLAVKKVNDKAGFIDVRLVNRQSKVYYVIGEVNNPGSFPLAGRETVLDGVVAAGGTNDRASVKNIILVRPNCQVLSVEYKRIVQLGQIESNYQLMPGDRIFVPSKNFFDDLLDCLHHRDDDK